MVKSESEKRGGLRVEGLGGITSQKRQQDCRTPKKRRLDRRTPNDTRTSSADGDGGGAWSRGRGGESAWRPVRGSEELVAAIPAVLHGPGRGLYAGRGVHRRDSRIGADWGPGRVLVCVDRLLPGAFVRAHFCATFSFWGRDAHGDGAASPGANGAIRVGDSHFFRWGSDRRGISGVDLAGRRNFCGDISAQAAGRVYDCVGSAGKRAEPGESGSGGRGGGGWHTVRLCADL